MLNELSRFLTQHSMLQPGDKVYCAVSGGADSMALLWAMYLLKEKLGITVFAAHFNHQLRGEESDRDEAFVRAFCHHHDIPLQVGTARILPGEKGLEAAARTARYEFLATLPGKVATAHTANDNAETVLMHMLRGTGLKGLGGISPVRGKYIRPMLSVTREQVISFLDEYHISHVTDSSNASDAFLRNRLRNRVMPLLYEENPRLAQTVSAMALRLRADEEALTVALPEKNVLDIAALKGMPQAVRSRMLCAFLERCGVKEPLSSHIALAESLVFSENPSAKAGFPGGITLMRCYGTLQPGQPEKALPCIPLSCPGTLTVPELSLKINCREADTLIQNANCFTVRPIGQLMVRSRQSGDTIRTSGGTKTLKKLFIDRKIPAARRDLIPVFADDAGVLAVAGVGVHPDRVAKELPAVQISLEYTDKEKREDNQHAQ